MRLRPFRAEDEAAARAAHAAVMRQDDFGFLVDHRDGESWDAFLARRRGERLPDGLVSAALLAAVVDGHLAGRVSVRYVLNDWLAAYAGHIGYAVIPSERRKGYATEMLRRRLAVPRAAGVDDVLVTCDVGNVDSARVIETCGGKFESVIEGDGETKRRYWFR